MFYFTCSNTKCQCTKSSVSCGVTITTNNCHPRLSYSLFRTDNMYYSLSTIQKWEKSNIKIFTIFFKCFNLNSTFFIFNTFCSIRSWNVMISHSKSTFRSSYFTICISKAFKCLRACDFVNKMTVYVYKTCSIFLLINKMV